MRNWAGDPMEQVPGSGPSRTEELRAGKATRPLPFPMVSWRRLRPGGQGRTGWTFRLVGPVFELSPENRSRIVTGSRTTRMNVAACFVCLLDFKSIDSKSLKPQPRAGETNPFGPRGLCLQPAPGAAGQGLVPDGPGRCGGPAFHLCEFRRMRQEKRLSRRHGTACSGCGRVPLHPAAGSKGHLNGLSPWKPP